MSGLAEAGFVLVRSVEARYGTTPLGLASCGAVHSQGGFGLALLNKFVHGLR